MSVYICLYTYIIDVYVHNMYICIYIYNIVARARASFCDIAHIIILWSWRALASSKLLPWPCSYHKSKYIVSAVLLRCVVGPVLLRCVVSEINWFNKFEWVWKYYISFLILVLSNLTRKMLRFHVVKIYYYIIFSQLWSVISGHERNKTASWNIPIMRCSGVVEK